MANEHEEDNQMTKSEIVSETTLTRLVEGLFKDPSLLHERFKLEASKKGTTWQRLAENAYGFAYGCKHADICGISQEFLTDEQQADLLKGKLPDDGRVRMCEECFTTLERARRAALKQSRSPYRQLRLKLSRRGAI